MFLFGNRFERTGIPRLHGVFRKFNCIENVLGNLDPVLGEQSHQFPDVMDETEPNIHGEENRLERFLRSLLCVEAVVFPQDFVELGLSGANEVAPGSPQPIAGSAPLLLVMRHRALFPRLPGGISPGLGAYTSRTLLPS